MSNQTSIDTDELLSELNNEKAKLFIPAILYVGVLMILGTFGNFIVLYFYGFKTKPTPSTGFIMALAVFDVISCLLGMPMEIADLRYYFNFKSVIACKTLRVVTHFASIGSGLTLVIIAIDRYRRICKPFERQLNRKHVKVACVVIFIMAAVLSWPAAVFNKVVDVDVKSAENVMITGHDCTTSKEDSLKTYIFVFNVVYFVGFIIITGILSVLYTFVGKQLYRHKKFRFYVAKKRTRTTRIKVNPAPNAIPEEGLLRMPKEGTPSSEVFEDPPDAPESIPDLREFVTHGMPEVEFVRPTSGYTTVNKAGGATRLTGLTNKSKSLKSVTICDPAQNQVYPIEPRTGGNSRPSSGSNRVLRREPTGNYTKGGGEEQGVDETGEKAEGTDLNMYNVERPSDLIRVERTNQDINSHGASCDIPTAHEYDLDIYSPGSPRDVAMKESNDTDIYSPGRRSRPMTASSFATFSSRPSSATFSHMDEGMAYPDNPDDDDDFDGTFVQSDGDKHVNKGSANGDDHSAGPPLAELLFANKSSANGGTPELELENYIGIPSADGEVIKRYPVEPRLETEKTYISIPDETNDDAVDIQIDTRPVSRASEESKGSKASSRLRRFKRNTVTPESSEGGSTISSTITDVTLTSSVASRASTVRRFKKLFKQSWKSGKMETDTDKIKELRTKMLDINTIKYTMIMITITVLFVISFLPYLSLVIWRYYETDHESNVMSDTQLVLFQIGIRSIFLQSSLNPIIYGGFNSKFRAFFYTAFCACCVMKKRHRKLTIKKSRDNSDSTSGS